MNAPSTIFSDESEFIQADTRRTRWAIPYHPECLNARIENLLAHHSEFINGKQILDLASHIGTMSYAALQLGADHVHGIDTEPRTVEMAESLFEKHQVDTKRYRFEVRDAFEFLEEKGPDRFDTLLCLGMLYYTAEPYRLLKRMCESARQCVIVDTFTAAYAALQGKDAQKILPHMTDAMLEMPMMLTSLTQAEKKDYTLPDSFIYKEKEISLTSFPTQTLLETWMMSLGVTFEKIDWSRYATRPCSWRDLVTPEQKKSSHWADVYTSDVRVSYLIHTSS